MKKQLTTLFAITLLSGSVYAQNVTTPEGDIDPSQEGISKEEAAAGLQKVVEVGKVVAQVIADSIEEVKFQQIIDSTEGGAELSYNAGLKGTAYETSDNFSRDMIDIDIEYYQSSIKLYQEFIANYQSKIDSIIEELKDARGLTKRRLNRQLNENQEKLDKYTARLEDHQRELVKAEKEKSQLTKTTYRLGLYNAEIALNAVSDEAVITLQEAYLHAVGLRLQGKFGDLSMYGVGVSFERFEKEGENPVAIANFVVAGVEYELHIRLTDDGKVKLLLAAGGEFGVTGEATGDGLYLNSYANIGVQVGNLVIEAMIKGRATGAVTVDNQEEFLMNAGYVQPELQITYHFDDNFAAFGNLNYNTGTERATFSLGVKTNPEAIGNFFKSLGKKD